MDIITKFEKAAEQINTLSVKPDTDTLLKLYSLYKQASIGDAPDDGGYVMFDFKAKAKHDAWLQLRSTTKEDAMNQYIALVNSLLNL